MSALISNAHAGPNYREHFAPINANCDVVNQPFTGKNPAQVPSFQHRCDNSSFLWSFAARAVPRRIIAAVQAVQPLRGALSAVEGSKPSPGIKSGAGFLCSWLRRRMKE